jgi:hypothetical protein
MAIIEAFNNMELVIPEILARNYAVIKHMEPLHTQHWHLILQKLSPVPWRPVTWTYRAL